MIAMIKMMTIAVMMMVPIVLMTLATMKTTVTVTLLAMVMVKWRLMLTKTTALWGVVGRFDAIRPKGCGFESWSSRHVGTLIKPFTRRCLWHFSVKLQYSIRAVSRVSLSSIGLEEAL